MRMHVLGGPDLVLGFRLAGIRGDVVSGEAQALHKVEELARDADVAVLLVSAFVAKAAQEAISSARVRQGFPIVIEVAEPGEPARDPESLMRFVGEAVGLKL